MKVGCMVFLVHDINDIFMEAAKMARYAGRQTLCTVLFVTFMLSWFASRIYYLPAYIIRSCLTEPITVRTDTDTYYSNCYCGCVLSHSSVSRSHAAQNCCSQVKPGWPLQRSIAPIHVITITLMFSLMFLAFNAVGCRCRQYWPGTTLCYIQWTSLLPLWPTLLLVSSAAVQCTFPVIYSYYDGQCVANASV